jgi:hypothetical protein
MILGGLCTCARSGLPARWARHLLLLQICFRLSALLVQWCVQAFPPCGSFAATVHPAIFPAIGKIKAAQDAGQPRIMAIASAIPDVVAAMSHGMACRELCESVVGTCSCVGDRDHPLSFGEAITAAEQSNESFKQVPFLCCQGLSSTATMQALKHVSLAGAGQCIDAHRGCLSCSYIACNMTSCASLVQLGLTHLDDEFKDTLFRDVWNKPLCDIFTPQSDSEFRGLCPTVPRSCDDVSFCADLDQATKSMTEAIIAAQIAHSVFAFVDGPAGLLPQGDIVGQVLLNTFPLDSGASVERVQDISLSDLR